LTFVTAAGGVGWIARDRAERQTRLAAQLGVIVADVETLMANQKWLQALATAQRAETALTVGAADGPTHQHISQLLKDLEFVERLEQIGMETATSFDRLGKFKGAPADQQYANAFAQYGVDVEQLPVAESISRLKTRPALAIPVGAGLDAWIELRRRCPAERAAGWKRLVEIALAIDPDPLRNRLRAIWGKDVTPERQAELRGLSKSINVTMHHPATLISLIRTLNRADVSDSAIPLLYQAQSAHPQNFSLNFELGDLFYMQKDYDVAVRFLTAARSLRPNAAIVRYNLGLTLEHLGKVSEVKTEYRQAILLNPDFALAHYNLGSLHQDQGELSKAEAEYREAIRLAPDFAEPTPNWPS
jgi:serine/threonine-protein kinase